MLAQTRAPVVVCRAPPKKQFMAQVMAFIAKVLKINPVVAKTANEENMGFFQVANQHNCAVELIDSATTKSTPKKLQEHALDGIQNSNHKVFLNYLVPPQLKQKVTPRYRQAGGELVRHQLAHRRPQHRFERRFPSPAGNGCAACAAFVCPEFFNGRPGFDQPEHGFNAGVATG